VTDGVVIFYIRPIVLDALVLLAREKGPENADQGEKEDDTSGDRDRNQDDNTSREEFYGKLLTMKPHIFEEINHSLRWLKLKVEKEWKRAEMEPAAPEAVEETMYGMSFCPSKSAAEALPSAVSRDPETISIRSISTIPFASWVFCRGTIVN